MPLAKVSSTIRRVAAGRLPEPHSRAVTKGMATFQWRAVTTCKGWGVLLMALAFLFSFDTGFLNDFFVELEFTGHEGLELSG